MAKRTTPEKRVKLLVCIIKKGDEIALTEACNEQCVALSFSGLGYGTAKSHYLSYLGLDEIEKRIVYSLIPNYSEARVLRAINKKLKLYLMGNGIAFTIPLSGISNLISNAVLSTPMREDAEAQKNTKERGKRKMHELIVAVVNQKFTDAVLDASRAAGATGATILPSPCDTGTLYTSPTLQAESQGESVDATRTSTIVDTWREMLLNVSVGESAVISFTCP